MADDFDGAIRRGWESYNALVLASNAPDLQRSECRLAFYAGSAVLFYAIMRMLDPGEEPTDADLAKMDAISNEIDAFAKTFDQQWLDRFKR